MGTFELPAKHNITEASKCVLDICAAMRKTITLSEAAVQLMASVSAFAGVKASVAVEQGQTTESVRWRITTWKVSVLAGLIFAFDHFIRAGQQSGESLLAFQRTSSRRTLHRMAQVASNYVSRLVKAMPSAFRVKRPMRNPS